MAFTSVDKDQLVAALEALEIEPTEEMLNQALMFVVALKTYEKKDQMYGQAWKRLGALNNLTRMATKVERLLEQFWHREDNRNGADLDDAVDLLNYDAFFMRQAIEGEWTKESK
jgi:hypothetical protein